MKNYIGKRNGEGKKIGIVVGTFYRDIADSLVKGASEALREGGVAEDDIHIYSVAGALEIPLLLKKLAERGILDGLIALGAVIRGATAHFEYVSHFATQATSQLSLDCNIPILNGILTVENMAQAQERVDGSKENKGRDCGTGVLEMLDIIEQI
jgi:6,7-dimethyl-8-ribityllumazine synthase